jgi:hypothetical protein
VSAHDVPVQSPDQPAKVLVASGVAASVTPVPSAKPDPQLPLDEPEEIAQLIPAGADVTLPPPVPAPATLSVRSGIGAKDAVTLCGAFMVTWHVPVPVQSPLHPVNRYPDAGVAVSVTAVPVTSVLLHVPLAVALLTVQLMPAGLEVTVPLPVPLPLTLSAYVTRVKVAVTLRPVVRLT